MGVFGTVSFRSECVESLYLVDCAVGQMVMVIFSGIALLPPIPLVHLRESPEFSSLASTDKSAWPRFLLWHGRLPGLPGHDGAPWALSDADVARERLDAALGSYPPDLWRTRAMDEHYDSAEVAEHA